MNPGQSFQIISAFAFLPRQKSGLDEKKRIDVIDKPAIEATLQWRNLCRSSSRMVPVPSLGNVIFRLSSTSAIARINSGTTRAIRGA